MARTKVFTLPVDGSEPDIEQLKAEEIRIMRDLEAGGIPKLRELYSNAIYTLRDKTAEAKKAGRIATMKPIFSLMPPIGSLPSERNQIAITQVPERVGGYDYESAYLRDDYLRDDYVTSREQVVCLTAPFTFQITHYLNQRILSPEIKYEIDIMFVLSLERTGKWRLIHTHLVKWNSEQQSYCFFHHQHGQGYDNCYGTYTLPDYVTGYEQLLKIRDDLEVLFQSVNHGWNKYWYNKDFPREDELVLAPKERRVFHKGELKKREGGVENG